MIITAYWKNYEDSQEAIKSLKKDYQEYMEYIEYDDQPIIFLYDYGSKNSQMPHPYSDKEKTKVTTRRMLENNVHEILRELYEYFWEKNISVIYFLDKNDYYFRQENKQLKQWKIIDNLQQPINKINSTNNGITQTKISSNSDEDLEKLYQSIFS